MGDLSLSLLLGWPVSLESGISWIFSHGALKISHIIEEVPKATKQKGEHATFISSLSLSVVCWHSSSNYGVYLFRISFIAALLGPWLVVGSACKHCGKSNK